MDVVVYIVNADALTQEELSEPGEELNAQLWDHFRGPREELNALLSNEAFANAPFLIFGLTPTGALFQLKERFYYFIGLPNVTIELVDANAHPIKAGTDPRVSQRGPGPPLSPKIFFFTE